MKNLSKLTPRKLKYFFSKIKKIINLDISLLDLMNDNYLEPSEYLNLIMLLVTLTINY